jgi:hypothetical protein
MLLQLANGHLGTIRAQLCDHEQPSFAQQQPCALSCILGPIKLFQRSSRVLRARQGRPLVHLIKLGDNRFYFCSHRGFRFGLGLWFGDGFDCKAAFAHMFKRCTLGSPGSRHKPFLLLRHVPNFQLITLLLSSRKHRPLWLVKLDLSSGSDCRLLIHLQQITSKT